MQRPELYQKTVDILVQAYFNDTLEHGNPCGCAVGNIIAANLGKKITMVTPTHASKLGWDGDKNSSGLWYDCIRRPGDLLSNESKIEIKSSGYSVPEIIKIESAFEGARPSFRNKDDDTMFNGLMAVIEALDRIHENTDTELTTTTKKRFNKTLTVS